MNNFEKINLKLRINLTKENKLIDLFDSLDNEFKQNPEILVHIINKLPKNEIRDFFNKLDEKNQSNLMVFKAIVENLPKKEIVDFFEDLDKNLKKDIEKIDIIIDNANIGTLSDIYSRMPVTLRNSPEMAERFLDKCNSTSYKEGKMDEIDERYHLYYIECLFKEFGPDAQINTTVAKKYLDVTNGSIFIDKLPKELQKNKEFIKHYLDLNNYYGFRKDSFDYSEFSDNEKKYIISKYLENAETSGYTVSTIVNEIKNTFGDDFIDFEISLKLIENSSNTEAPKIYKEITSIHPEIKNNPNVALSVINKLTDEEAFKFFKDLSPKLKQNIGLIEVIFEKAKHLSMDDIKAIEVKGIKTDIPLPIRVLDVLDKDTKLKILEKDSTREILFRKSENYMNELLDRIPKEKRNDPQIEMAALENIAWNYYYTRDESDRQYPNLYSSDFERSYESKFEINKEKFLKRLESFKDNEEVALTLIKKVSLKRLEKIYNDLSPELQENPKIISQINDEIDYGDIKSYESVRKFHEKIKEKIKEKEEDFSKEI